MEKRTIKDIKQITRSTPRRSSGAVEVPIHVVKSLPREIPYEPEEHKPSSRYGLWYIAVICVVGFLFSLSFLFERATVRVTPKSVALAFDATDTYTAEKDSVAENAIVYNTLTLSGDESIKIPSTQSQTQSMSATGTVFLYNAYAKTPYKLVKSTRLSTPDGKMYRINSAVTIPGYTGSGVTFVPGSVTVSATAIAVGEDYNLTVSDFSIPGLSGTPQFSKIYGRTKTAMSGGTSGTVYTLPADVANAALGTLAEKLKSSLLNKAKAQVPEGYILYEGATVFTTDETIEAPYSKESEVPLVLHGSLTAYLIKKDTLVNAIAEKSVSQYAHEPVTIPGIESLSLVPVGTLTPGTDTAMTFSFSGQASVVWDVDSESLKTTLSNHKKNEFESLVSGVVGVEKAQVVLKPFWKQSFPSDPSRISIIVEKAEISS